MTVKSTKGKLVFRKLKIMFQNKTTAPAIVTNVLEWKWENGEISIKTVGDVWSIYSDADIVSVKETKEIVYNKKDGE